VSCPVYYEAGKILWFTLSAGTTSQTAGQSGWVYISFENPGAYSLRVRYPEAGVSAFSIGSNAGTINEANKTITVNLPFGTDLNSLTPTVTAASGWTCTSTGARNFTDAVEYVFTKGDITQIYMVIVVPDGQGGININPPSLDDINIEGFPAATFTLSKSGEGGFLTTRTINLTGTGYTSIEWWIGDSDKTSAATNGGRTFAVQANTLTLGKHTLTAIVYKDNVPYSNEIDFTIVQ
jgi:hypothetical protein